MTFEVRPHQNAREWPIIFSVGRRVHADVAVTAANLIFKNFLLRVVKDIAGGAKKHHDLVIFQKKSPVNLVESSGESTPKLFSSPSFFTAAIPVTMESWWNPAVLLKSKTFIGVIAGVLPFSRRPLTAPQTIFWQQPAGGM